MRLPRSVAAGAGQRVCPPRPREQPKGTVRDTAQRVGRTSATLRRQVMSRSDTEKEIRETLGQVPSFFASMPDSTLENEWREFKVFQLTDTALTAREKQLIGY